MERGKEGISSGKQYLIKSAGRGPCESTLFLGDIDKDSVGIGELVLTVAARGD